MLEIAMTTIWLLLLAFLSSSQSVDGQSTSDERVCDGKSQRKLERDVEMLLQQLSAIQESLSIQQQQLSVQQQILRELQTVVNRLDPVKPQDCSEIQKSGECSDGVYTVYLGSAQSPTEVYCDMTTDGGGWTVFQRRQDGSEDFYRNWTDYATGFGNLTGEFWLGNDNLHFLTSGKRQQLRIDLGDFEGNSRYAEYDNFKVDSACELYTLSSLGTYSGDAGDSMIYRHLGKKFSTPDQDNDPWTGSCAVTYKGAWWYGSCHRANLNGLYLRGVHTSEADGINWLAWTGHYYSLRFTEMKIRPY